MLILIKIVWKNEKCKSSFWIFNSKFEISCISDFQTSTRMNIKGIRVKVLLVWIKSLEKCEMSATFGIVTQNSNWGHF